jgi:hypothetical protein
LRVRALRVVPSRIASLKPAARNSSRKAPPSLAPAIHANQSSSGEQAAVACGVSRRINSALYTDPPTRTTRANSAKTASRAGLRLKIPLTNATSIAARLIGRFAASASQKNILLRPASILAGRARLSIAALKSNPRTIPVWPTRRAAINESSPAPHPRSNTRMPRGKSAKTETLDTPVKASTAVAGITSSTSAGYPRLAANSRPTGNGCVAKGVAAAVEYAFRTATRSRAARVGSSSASRFTQPC